MFVPNIYLNLNLTLLNSIGSEFDMLMFKRKMKKTLLILVLIAYGLINNLFAQKIYRVEYESQADVKVFIVDYESQCDLKVYRVDYQSQAKGNKGKWYFVDYASQADKKVFFVKYQSQADIKIYMVDYESQSGWREKSKQYIFF